MHLINSQQQYSCDRVFNFVHMFGGSSWLGNHYFLTPRTNLRKVIGFEVSERGFRYEGYHFLYFLVIFYILVLQVRVKK